MSDSAFIQWRNAKPLCEFWVDARPQGKERHVNGGRSTLRTRAYESEVIGSCARDAWGEREPFGHLVGVRITMYFISLVKKPDIDNVIKSLYDGMRGIIIYDDDQIVYEESLQLSNDTQGMWVEIIRV